jgi:hypothetical protein
MDAAKITVQEVKENGRVIAVTIQTGAAALSITVAQAKALAKTLVAMWGTWE